MNAATQYPPVSDLHGDAIGVKPVDHDWGESWTETWDYIEAPECLECGSYAEWIKGTDIIAGAHDHPEDQGADWADEDWEVPPLHFCDLPRMAGRGESDRDRWIVAGCMESARIADLRAGRVAERLTDLIEEGR